MFSMRMDDLRVTSFIPDIRKVLQKMQHLLSD